MATPATGGSAGGALAGAQRARVDAACPLCGALLQANQEWCLSCGAAARTRLAAPSNWKTPILALALIVTFALGGLAAALVKLTGGSGTGTAVAPITTTITSFTSTGSTAGAQGATAATPGVLGGTPVQASPGALNPGTPTTLTLSSSATTGTAPATATGPAAGAPAKTGGGTSRSSEEALRKAGFLPRGGK